MHIVLVRVRDAHLAQGPPGSFPGGQPHLDAQLLMLMYRFGHLEDGGNGSLADEPGARHREILGVYGDGIHAERYRIMSNWWIDMSEGPARRKVRPRREPDLFESCSGLFTEAIASTRSVNSYLLHPRQLPRVEPQGCGAVPRVPGRPEGRGSPGAWETFARGKDWGWRLFWLWAGSATVLSAGEPVRRRLRRRRGDRRRGPIHGCLPHRLLHRVRRRTLLLEQERTRKAYFASLLDTTRDATAIPGSLRGAVSFVTGRSQPASATERNFSRSSFVMSAIACFRSSA